MRCCSALAGLVLWLGVHSLLWRFQKPSRPAFKLSWVEIILLLSAVIASAEILKAQEFALEPAPKGLRKIATSIAETSITTSAAAIDAAREELTELEALDAEGRITAIGRRIRTLPLPPRLARMAISAAELGHADEAAEIATRIPHPRAGVVWADATSIDRQRQAAAHPHLLSPVHRPIQITRDLPGFWKGSWTAVKAEMKGRYPRHPWPDDPALAIPTARAKRRGT